MKQLPKLLIFSLLLTIVGCSKEYDDSALVGRVNNLESRVLKLEQLCQQMNTNISSLQTIVSALQNNDYVTGVVPVTEGGKNVGYTISFTKSQPVTIYHGKDGVDGKNGTDGKDGQNGADGKDGKSYVPVIGVRQDTDGVYYWTLDGKWLIDGSGNKVKAEGRDGKNGADGKDGLNGSDGRDGADGKNGQDGADGKDGANGADGRDGITPVLKIEDNYWLISYDNGGSWTKLGKATGENGRDGDSFFQDVTQDDSKVHFILADGTVITLPKAVELDIVFAESDLVVMSPNSTRTISFTVTSTIKPVVVEVVSSADIKTKVILDDADGLAGKIQLTTSSVIDEYSKVVVFVSNGEKVIMRSIRFEEAGLKVEENSAKTISAEGGEVTLEFLANVECEVIIPDEAKSWISVVPDTRAMEKHTIALVVQPNESAARRTDIQLKSFDAKLYVSYSVSQDANINYQTAVEREALIAIYHALNGDSWENGYNKNWCTDTPIKDWYGVDVNGEGFVTSLYLTGLGKIPSDIKKLSCLEKLVINYYQGDYYEIPNAILSLEKLKYLHLYGTHLRGTIPNGIGNLVCLKHLDISDTNINGSIPNDIGTLNDLEYLDLSFNKLSGELPESMGNLKKLKHIMLRFNQLTGNVPDSVQNLPIWKYDWGRIINGNCFNEKTLSIPAPHLMGKTMDGDCVEYDDNSNGYFVLIQWSAQYDGYMYSQIDVLNKIFSKYGKNVTMVGLLSSDREQGEGVVKAYISQNGILWPNIYWQQEDNVIEGQYIQFNGISRHEYAAPTFPAIFIFHEKKVVYWDLDVFDGVSGLDDYLSINIMGEQPDYYISSDYTQDGKVTTLQSSTEGKGINIVLMGDAYSDRQIADGTYGADMKYIYDNLFTEEPYKSFKEYFNVYSVNVVSATEGYEHEGATLGGYFGDGTLVGGNDSKCFEYAAKAVGEQNMDETLVVVAMNSNNYAGTCYMYYPSSTTGTYGSGISVAYFPKGGDKETFARLLHHEACGHGFAKLADEYAYESMGAVPNDYASQIQTQQSSWGWWKNVDFTSDVSSVRWNAFTNDSRYANEGLGAFEGGLTYWTGVWRPTVNSIMRDNTGGFNAPSREAIYCRIHKLAYGDSWNYSYEDFVTYDEINRKASSSSAPRRSSGRQTRWEPLHPPVVVGKSWKEAAKTQ